MPNKTEEYLALACKTADSFSRQWEHWAEFLITAARLYKYSYPDQLMSYDDVGRELQFKSAAAMGVTYMLLERCGLDPAGWFDEKDFQAVYDFTTPSAVYALGTAVSDCSREVLRQIERTVKTTIRRRNIERSQEEYEQQSELHEDRGLFSAEPDLESAPEAAEPVRKDAPELSDGEAPGGVQHDAAERDPVPAPMGGGTDGRKQDATADERTVGEEPGSGQGEKPDGVGAAHEQPESAGGGNDPDRADLQLSFLEAAIPTEAQQIESIDQAENEKSSSAFVLSQTDIEKALRRGSNFENSKLRIWEIYQTQPDRKLRAKALAKEYAPHGPGGCSHTYLDGSSGWLDHDSKGLTFEHAASSSVTFKHRISRGIKIYSMVANGWDTRFHTVSLIPRISIVLRICRYSIRKVGI